MKYARAIMASVLILASLAATGWTADEPGPPAAAAAKPGPQTQEFQRVFTEWKALLGELAGLQVKYRTADEAKRTEIQVQWNQLVAKGEQLEPKLIETAEKAYAEAPNADKQLTEFLVKMVGSKVNSDDYEPAARIGKLLMANKCDDKRLPALAGVAAFAVSDYAAAEQYLKQAEESQVALATGRDYVDGLVQAFLREPARFKQTWAKEQKIRENEAEADNLPRVLLKTARGDIEIELFENEAPQAVANFIYLVQKGFYNGLTFHRVLPGFMAQGGCPKGDGTGGPGYTIPCECYQPNYRRHFRGSLSMAHAGRDTGGSQFFLTFVPTQHLDGKHTAFGRVIDGMDVLAKLQRRDPGDPEAPRPDKILSAEVIRKRPHEYVPKKMPE